MTIIEFYDKVSLDNIAGAMLCNADRVILVGDHRGKMERSMRIYESILRNRNNNTTLSYMSINRNNLQNIVSVLSQIALSDDECVFDLTGGEDLYLVGIGIVMNKFEGHVQCHRFNFHNNMLYDCDADGNVCSTRPFSISIEETVSMYGGMVVKDENRPLHTYNWDLTDDFYGDIEIMWDICKRDVGLWNLQTAIIGMQCDITHNEDSLEFFASYDLVSSTLSQKRIEYVKFIGFLKELLQHGIISSLNTNNGLYFEFKNQQTKRCLVLPGQILELIIAKKMRALTNKDGTPLYNEVNVGVVIDWDRTDEDNIYRTINEIDIMAMKGAIPIFISCKNGNFDENELYKLSTVSERFGNKYAKKVLIATKLDKFGLRSDYLRARMKDMEIRCIDNITSLTNDQLDATLRSLWIN